MTALEPSDKEIITNDFLKFGNKETNYIVNSSTGYSSI